MTDDELDPEEVAEMEAKLFPLVRARLADPPVPTRYLAGVVTGYFISEPAPGSETRRCDHCDEETVLGPKSLLLLTLDPKIAALCYPCMFTMMAIDHTVAYDVREAPE